MQQFNLSREQVIKGLVATGKWSEAAARIGERTGYRCDYCDLDFLTSSENYKMWQIDHIVPQKHGGSNDAENLTPACRVCNMDFKGKYDPRNHAPANATREQLIEAARVYIRDQMQRTLQEVATVRKIVGWSGD